MNGKCMTSSSSFVAEQKILSSSRTKFTVHNFVVSYGISFKLKAHLILILG